MISTDTPNATSSPASAAGPTPYVSLTGQMTLPFGPEAAPASRSVSPESDWEPPITAISGRSSSGLSPSERLQLSLESRLAAATDLNGSPEFKLTWKHSVMRSGLRICRLRASPRRTNDSGYSGWPTPAARDWRSGKASLDTLERNGHPLNEVVRMSAWDTPQASWSNAGAKSRGGKRKAELLTPGLIRASFAVSSENTGELAPEFDCWLMGFPAEWVLSGGSETPSSRR